MADNGRERNKRATRRALRAATLELGLERGLGEVPIDEIAKRAGVSTRTFFNYFDTKDDAALIEIFQVTDEELAAFASRGSAGAWADLSAMLVADVERVERDGQDLPRYMQLHARHPVLQARQMGTFAAFLGRLSEAVASRTGEEFRLRAELMAGSCITAVRVGLDRWAAEGLRAPAATHVTAAFAAFDGAFGDHA